MSEKQRFPAVYLTGLAIGLVGFVGFWMLMGWQVSICVLLMFWGNNITERYTL